MTNYISGADVKILQNFRQHSTKHLNWLWIFHELKYSSVLHIRQSNSKLTNLEYNKIIAAILRLNIKISIYIAILNLLNYLTIIKITQAQKIKKVVFIQCSTYVFLCTF